MRSFKILLGVLLIAAPFIKSAHADQLDKIKERGKIVIGIKNDYKPFGFLDADGVIQGFEIDLAKYIGEKIAGPKGKIELVPVVASNRIELLNQGRVDVLVATLGRTAERAKILDYSKDYYMLGEGAVVMRIGAKPQKMSDLKGVNLCGILGNSFNRALTERYGANMTLFQGTSEMSKAFEDNRCEGIGYDEPLLRQKLLAPDWKGKYALTLPAESFIGLAAGVRKNEPALLDAVNKAILQAEAAGLVSASAEKYNLSGAKFLADQQASAKTKQ